VRVRVYRAKERKIEKKRFNEKKERKKTKKKRKERKRIQRYAPLVCGFNFVYILYERLNNNYVESTSPVFVCIIPCRIFVLAGG